MSSAGTYFKKPSKRYGISKATQGDCTIGLNAAKRKMLKACTHTATLSSKLDDITVPIYTSTGAYIKNDDGTYSAKMVYYKTSSGSYSSFTPYRKTGGTTTYSRGYSKATLSGSGASMVDYDGTVGVNIYCPYNTSSFTHTKCTLTQAKLTTYSATDAEDGDYIDGGDVYKTTDLGDDCKTTPYYYQESAATTETKEFFIHEDTTST